MSSMRLVRPSSLYSGQADNVATRYKRPPSHLRLQSSRVRRVAPVARDVFSGNNLVFGPGGQASIVAPQAVSNGPGLESQSSDQSPVEANDPSQAPQGVTGVPPAVKQQTEEPSTPSSAATISFGSSTNSMISSASPASTESSTPTMSSGSIATTPPPTTTSASSNSAIASTSASASSTTSLSLTSTSLASSSSAVPSASSMSTTSSSRATSHRGSAYAGIAFGVIAAIASIVALCVWWMRVRGRARKRILASATTWPWDKDPTGSIGRDQEHVGSGNGNLPGANAFGLWDTGEPKLPRPTYTSFDPLYPADGIGGITSENMHSYLHPPAPVHTSGIAGAYPTVQLCSANSSVPDLAPDLGTLQVVNLMPGDLSSDSSDGGSRASSALGLAGMSHNLSSDYGTPYHPMASERPRFLGLHGSGLTVPWANNVRSRGNATRSGAVDSLSEKDIGPLPYPGDRTSRAAPEPGGWAASFKSNIVNAINAVVGGSGHSGEPLGDHLTTPPLRKKRLSTSGHREATVPRLGVLSRTNTVHSIQSSVKEWTSEQTTDETGAVQVCLDEAPFDLTSWLSDVYQQDDVQAPPAVIIKSGNWDSAPRPSSVDQNTSGARFNGTHVTGDIDPPNSHSESGPPQLPEIPSVSRTPTVSSTVESSRGQYRSAKNRHATRKKIRPSRANMKRASSRCSVGSGLSRHSSMHSEQLTDAEEFAKKMLRERRKRIMEMDVGRRQTRRQPRNTRESDNIMASDVV